jgi:DNA-binding LacI/PurR family transcriptional regulator
MAVIKDVAKLAGVSVAAVSKYLKTPENMREETRRQIEAAIQELNYRPSPVAQSLRTRKTGMVAVMMPAITNPFFAELFDALRRALLKKGYTALLQTANDVDELRIAMFSLSIRQVDGVVLCFLDDESLVAELAECSIGVVPLVAMSWHSIMEGCGVVLVDVRDGMRQAVTHLVETGRKRIAYIGGPESSHISREKISGYRAALEAAGLQADPTLVLHGGYSLESGYLAATQLLKGRHRPDAVAAENDMLAVGCIKRLAQEGIAIPADIAVTGFDDIPLSSMYEPPISTVRLPIEHIGVAAVDMLAVMIEGGAPSADSAIKPSLVVRRSSDSRAKETLTPRGSVK